jgi:hypothetical protein
MGDREPPVKTLVATRYHNRPWNAKRPTTLGAGLPYNPTVFGFRNWGLKLPGRDGNLRRHSYRSQPLRHVSATMIGGMVISSLAAQADRGTLPAILSIYQRPSMPALTPCAQ